MRTSADLIVETRSHLPARLQHAEIYGNVSASPSLPRNRIVELFLDEVTLQELANVAHRTDQFESRIGSAFLQTKCKFLCVGKLIPEVRRLVADRPLVATVSRIPKGVD